MDEFFKAFVDWLAKDYPALLTIIGFTIIFLYIIKELKSIFFMHRHDDNETYGERLRRFIFFWRRKKRKVIEPKNVHYSDEDREKVKSKLLIHNFFQSINDIKTRIPSMDFGYPRKNEVLRNVIKIYVETIEKYAACIIKNYKLDELSTQQLNDILVQEIEKISYEIFSKMKSQLGDDLYNKLIEDPVKGFRFRNTIFREIFINGVLLISSQSMSVYNYDNYERASELLTSMYVSLQVIVRNFEKVFKDYNGELDKYFK